MKNNISIISLLLRDFAVFCILIFPYFSFAQTDSIPLKDKLAGTWLIKSIMHNEILSEDFNPNSKDSFIFYANQTFSCSDNEYGYNQFGTWEIFDGNKISLIDSVSGETVVFEIQLIDERKMNFVSNSNKDNMQIFLERQE